MNERAGSSPPTSSMMIWMEGSARTRAASGVIGSFVRSSPSRGRVRSVSATAARVSRQPARSSSIARRDSRILMTPPPTVPRPSNPILTSFIDSPRPAGPRSQTRLACGSHYPIHRLASPAAAARTTPFISVDPPRLEWPSAGEVLEPAERLLDPLLVLDQRESHVALAVLTEPDARRDGHLRVLNEQLGELERAHHAERLGDRRPDEHRALGLRHRPAELVEPVDEDVPALPVDLDDLGDARLVALERDDTGDLDGLEGAVVQVRLDPPQRRDHPRVAAHEAEPPAGHVVGLRGREHLDPDVLRARHLEKGRWPSAITTE